MIDASGPSVLAGVSYSDSITTINISDRVEELVPSKQNAGFIVVRGVESIARRRH